MLYGKASLFLFKTSPLVKQLKKAIILHYK